MKHDGHVIEGSGGTIRIEGDALAALVAAAAEHVEGVRVRRPRRGLTVEVAEGRARVSLELAVRYGASLPETGALVQSGAADALRRSAGLEVDVVDVAIEELER